MVWTMDFDAAVDPRRREHPRRRAMAQGGWWGLGTMGVALPYAVLVGGPHQTLLVAASAGGFAMSAGLGLAATLLRLPERWHRPVMLIYSALHVLITVVLAIADGGADSPMALGFFGTFTFVAYAMPLRLLLLAYGPLNVAGYLAVYGVAGAHRPAYVPVELAGLLATAAACAQQHHRLLRQRRRLDEMARTDPLTGCLNRRGFDEALQAALAAARATASPLALVSIDLDDFKSVNDRRGHAAGDALLVATAEAIRAVIGPQAPVGRLGGDEFSVAIAGYDTREQREAIGYELARRIEASIGVSVMRPGLDTAQALLSAADGDLYRQKALRRAGPRVAGTRPVALQPAVH